MTPVCVIAAGPVGATMALSLMRAGFEVSLIERTPTPPDDPRAATLQLPTIAMLHDLGTGPSLIEQSLKAPLFQFRDRASDVVLAEFDYGRLAGKTEFPFAIQCEQVEVACTNLAALRAEGSSEILMDTQILGFDRSPMA